MPNTQLGDKSVYGPDLDSLTATIVSQGSGFDVVVQVGVYHREQRE